LDGAASKHVITGFENERVWAQAMNEFAVIGAMFINQNTSDGPCRRKYFCLTTDEAADGARAREQFEMLIT
jgi:hypothetical protein